MIKLCKFIQITLKNTMSIFYKLVHTEKGISYCEYLITFEIEGI